VLLRLMNTLYFDDGYLKEFDATVVVSNDLRVTLDKTAFYPQSGGQPSDTGFLTKDNEEFKIQCVEAPDHVHVLDKLGLIEGDKVHGIINWERRYRFMRSHTACHILSAIILKQTGAKITGNQIDFSKSRVDFSLESFDKDLMAEYVSLANQVIKEDHQIKTTILKKEEAMKIPDLVRLAMKVPDRDDIRVVHVEGVDVQACGGTHVRSTGEINGIRLIKAENKGKSNRRVYFELVDGD
jgi:misacylated tRNA(Ala) deacylase